MYWRNILSVFLVHAFNVKFILCIVNHMIISNIHNRTPKSNILFTDMCIGDFFNRLDFMKHWVEFMFYYYAIICEQNLNQIVDTSDCERREAPFTRYSWNIRIMCYVKIWKHLIAICSLVLRRGFLIQCTMLVRCSKFPPFVFS